MRTMANVSHLVMVSGFRPQRTTSKHAPSLAHQVSSYVLMTILAALHAKVQELKILTVVLTSVNHLVLLLNGGSVKLRSALISVILLLLV